MNTNSKFPNPDFLNDLTHKLGELLKQSPAKDIEQNLKAGVTSMLGKLDMVTAKNSTCRLKCWPARARSWNNWKPGWPNWKSRTPTKWP